MIVSYILLAFAGALLLTSAALYIRAYRRKRKRRMFVRGQRILVNGRVAVVEQYDELLRKLVVQWEDEQLAGVEGETVIEGSTLLRLDDLGGLQFR